MRETPSYGTRCSRRTSKCISSHSTVCELRREGVSLGVAALVCVGSGGGAAYHALDLGERERGGRHRQSDGERRIRLLSVSADRLSAEKDTR